MVSVFASSSAYSRITRRRSPTIAPGTGGSRRRSGLGARRHLGARRDRPRKGAGRHVHELPHAGELGVHEPPRALRRCGSRRTPPAACGAACQAVNCGVHRRVAHLAAERRRFHPVQAAVAGEQEDDDVDGGERGERAAPGGGPRRAGSRGPASRPRSSGRVAAVAAAATCPAASAAARGRRAPGMATKTTRPAYGFGGTGPSAARSPGRRRPRRDTVAISAPTIASGCRTSARVFVTRRRYFRLCM